MYPLVVTRGMLGNCWFFQFPSPGIRLVLFYPGLKGSLCCPYIDSSTVAWDFVYNVGVLLQWILILILIFNLHQPSTECWCWLEERPDVVLSAYPPHSITQFCFIGYKWKWFIDTTAEYGPLVMVSDLSAPSRCQHHCEGLDIEMNTNINIFPFLVKAFPQNVSVNLLPFYM